MGKRFHINKNGVPAPCKAKKGNCPLGADNTHFSDIEHAQDFADEMNESEHGLLPSMENSENRDDMNERAAEMYQEIRRLKRNSKPIEADELAEEVSSLEEKFKNTPNKKWEETKAVSFNGNGIPMSKGNLVVNGNGSEAKQKYFEDKIQEAGVDSSKLVESLNNDDNIYGQWNVESESKDSITLQSEDFHGNERNLRVSKEQLEEKIRPKNETRSYSKEGIPTSMANYVYSPADGRDGSIRHFQEIVDSSELDADEMVGKLNNDKEVHGNWSVEDEDLQTIKLKKSDRLGNIDYVEVSKGI